MPMKTKNDHIEDLMIRLFVDDLDSAGRKELEEWISLSPQNRKCFDDEQEIWFSAEDKDCLSKYDKEKAFEVFRKRVSKVSTESRLRHYLRVGMKYTAGLVIVGILVFTAFFYSRNRVTSHFADVVIEAPRGGLAKLNLPDGSRVWLNSNSRIIYSQGFGITDRKLRLVGEGYFKVKKNPKLPFSIRSGNLHIRDLGTQFNVRNYPSDTEAEITLREGKVVFEDLRNTRKVYYLKPNQKAVIAKVNGKVMLENCDASMNSQWITGQLAFNGQPMQYLIQTLERNYNVKINVVNPEIMKCHFYGDFMKQEQSLNEILKALSSTGKFRYRIQGNFVTLY
jgi:ferric-dicitrate binding protein FerR (iron transport regulator)